MGVGDVEGLGVQLYNNDYDLGGSLLGGRRFLACELELQAGKWLENLGLEDLLKAILIESDFFLLYVFAGLSRIHQVLTDPLFIDDV